MIYTFKSRAAADLKMTGPVGDRVLSLIGKGPSSQGIIDVDQIPEALRALEAAVAAESPRPANDDDDDENDALRATPRGIIEVDQMSAAMSALEAAIAEKPAKQDADDDGAAAGAGFGPDRVGLRQRVWPMVEMMKRAAAENEPITWGT